MEDLPQLRFEILGSPIPKARPRWCGKGKRPRTPAATRAYEKLVGWLALQARSLWEREAPGEQRWNLDAQYSVAIELRFADNRRRDIDNCAKTILDGANKVLWKDDSQVKKLVVESKSGQGVAAALVRVEVQ